MQTAFDFLADVHGHASALEALLEGLGYRRTASGWRHPEGRKAAFVGDLVDRGPEQVRTLSIVRNMIDAGDAIAVMGNHEFNAIGFATPAAGGGHLRKRDGRNRHQHRRFLEEVGEDTPLHLEWTRWMRTLPLWIETDAFRLVHACWSPAHMHALGDVLDDGHRLTDDGVHRVNTPGTAEYEAAEVALKGLEVQLPSGCSYTDGDGIVRERTRIAWWDREATTFRAAALVEDDLRARLPSARLPPESLIPYDDAKPLFFGHYWLRDEPAILSPTMACLDYSVAKDGVLCAYSFDGEDALSPEKLSWVSARMPFEPGRHEASTGPNA